MKQVEINFTCAFFTISETFKAELIGKQLKFMQAQKKKFETLNKVWNSTIPLKCTVTEIGFEKPLQAAKENNRKSKEQNLPNADKQNYELHPIHATTFVPVRAAPFVIVIDGLKFIYYPKRKKFVCACQRSLTLSVPEVKELNKHKLLSVPKEYKTTFNYFANA